MSIDFVYFIVLFFIMSSILLAVYVRVIAHMCLYDCLSCSGAIEVLKYGDGINAIKRIIVF